MCNVIFASNHGCPASYQTSTAKGLMSCSDIHFETDFRWISNLFQWSTMSLNKILYNLMSYLNFVFTFPKVTIFSFIFIFVLLNEEIWSQNNCQKSFNNSLEWIFQLKSFFKTLFWFYLKYSWGKLIPNKIHCKLLYKCTQIVETGFTTIDTVQLYRKNVHGHVQSRVH